MPKTGTYHELQLPPKFIQRSHWFVPPVSALPITFTLEPKLSEPFKLNLQQRQHGVFSPLKFSQVDLFCLCRKTEENQLYRSKQMFTKMLAQVQHRARHASLCLPLPALSHNNSGDCSSTFYYYYPLRLSLLGFQRLEYCTEKLGCRLEGFPQASGQSL